MIIYRTRQFVEVRVGELERESLSAYVRGFAVAAEAVLVWLRGGNLAEVLELVSPHLAPAGGRASGYELHQPTA